MVNKPGRATPLIVERARKLRREATVPERLLWSVLRARRLAGLKFRRQYPIGPYIVDFYCQDARLVVEVDGMSHEDKQEQDAQREMYLREQGLRVFRVTNSDVNEDLEAVARAIVREAGIDSASSPALTPTLSQRERGPLHPPLS
jgi:very-short-patch-repair endonuclease